MSSVQFASPAVYEIGRNSLTQQLKTSDGFTGFGVQVLLVQKSLKKPHTVHLPSMVQRPYNNGTMVGEANPSSGWFAALLNERLNERRRLLWQESAQPHVRPYRKVFHGCEVF